MACVAAGCSGQVIGVERPDGSADPPRCGDTPCAAGGLCCDGRCIDPRSDPDHCGGCGLRCLVPCSEGACEVPACGRAGLPCCETSPPCSTGLLCAGATCVPESSCLPAGTPCSGGCCGDLSCRASRDAVQCCAEAGASCVGAADCCGRMDCVGGACLCRPEGATCVTSADCCDGRPCDGGTCNGPPDPCSGRARCQDCASQPGCGFCTTTGQCQTGYTYGPAAGPCADWHFSAGGCPTFPCDNRTDAPISPGVVLIVLDPRIEAEGGRKLTEVMGWRDPYALTDTLIEDVRRASCGYVNYQIQASREYDSFPLLIDGFRYDDATFMACIRDPAHTACHPEQIDYQWFVQAHGVIEDISAGATEVWLWGAPYFGPDEFAGKIPGDAPYGTPACNEPAAYWFYRPKNLPDLGRTYWVMGFSYERGVPEMEESYIHRIESTLSIELAGCRWLPDGADPWSRFTWINLHMPGQARCGARHFAPNSVADYDWGSMRSVPSCCDDYYSYPNLTNTFVSMDCTPWSCNGLGHASWWMAHLPHTGGTTDGKPNNWWKLVADYDRW